MSPRRPSSPHPGARSTPPTGTSAARGVPSPRGSARTSAARATTPGTARGSRSARGALGRASTGRGSSTRPTSRPPGGGRGPTGTVVEPPARLPRMFTVRALVLFVVLMLAFVLLFPTVRAHLAQQAENRQLAQEVEQARERTEELGAELDRWQDPAYVVAQARERLGFVRPGETAYRVVDPEVVPDPTAPAVPDAGTGPALVPAGTTTPWYSTIWESVRVAGEARVVAPGAGAGPAGAPAGVPSDVPSVPPAP